MPIVNVTIGTPSQIKVTGILGNPSGPPGSAGQSVEIQGAWTLSTVYTYRDIVYNNGVSYVCTSTHTATADNEAGAGGFWTGVWHQFAASPINDGASSTNTTYSSDKITTELATKAATSHNHAASATNTGQFSAALISAASVTQHIGSLDHNAMLNYSVGQHRTIDDASVAVNGLWSSSKINTMLAQRASVTHTHAVTDINTGTFAPALIPQGGVTQHQAALDHGSIGGLGDNDHTTYPTNAIASVQYTSPGDDFGIAPQNTMTGENDGQGMLKMVRSANTTTLPTKTAVQMFTMYDGSTLIGGWIDSNGASLGSGDHQISTPNDLYWYWDRSLVIGPNGGILIEDGGRVSFYEQAVQGDYSISVRAPESLTQDIDYVLPIKAASDGATLTQAIDGADNGKMRWEETQGAAFPTTNLFNGRKFVRTDLAEEFMYDDGVLMGSPLIPRWISLETVPYFFGRNLTSGVTGTQSFNAPGGAGTLNVNTGYHIQNDMLIVEMTAQSGQSVTADFRVKRDATVVATLSMTASQNAASARTIAGADIFLANDIMWADMDHTAGTIDDPLFVIHTKKFITA